LMREIAHAQKRNPLSDVDELLHDGRYPRPNHVGKFWWRSVKGFRCGGGSNVGLSHWLWSSSLQHSRTTVRVCDVLLWLIQLLLLNQINRYYYYVFCSVPPKLFGRLCYKRGR